ncbi:MAG: methyltransferase domain-containing protein [Dehalococcoidia bacterium]
MTRHGDPFGWRWNEILAGQGGWGDYWQEPAPEVLAFLQQLRRQGARRVLDVGCGLGRHLVPLATLGLEAHGTDLSVEGLEYARRWLTQEGLSAELSLAEMAHLPYGDGSFDAAMAISVINHGLRDDVAKAVAEVRRILKDGGFFLVTVTSKRAPAYGQGRRVGGDAFVHEDGGLIHYYVDRSGLSNLLRGFHLLEVVHKEEELLDLPQARFRAYWVAVARKAA